MRLWAFLGGSPFIAEIYIKNLYAVKLGYLTASDGGDQLIEVRYLADVGKLVQDQTDMDGQSPTVEVIRLVAEQIEKLTIHEGGYEIESAVRI